jgi:AcrR family transcriptional regulator
VTVGEVNDRRARKKARTRELIRDVAQALFDERGFETVTIAEIARAADVAVQTVFNHFPTKEELFFDGRVSWVGMAAEAVRSRASSLSPLTALRIHVIDTVGDLVASYADPERRRYLAALDGSALLQAHERELLHHSERRLRAALVDAWSAEAAAGRPVPDEPMSVAELTAALWLAGARSIIDGTRAELAGGADPEQTAAAAMDLADRVLSTLEASVELRSEGPSAGTDTGWPQEIRRAS